MIDERLLRTRVAVLEQELERRKAEIARLTKVADQAIDIGCLALKDEEVGITADWDASCMDVNYCSELAAYLREKEKGE